MKRHQDWPARLDEAVRSAPHRTFQYGQWDCCLAAADLVLAMTGSDIAAHFRGKYRSRSEALDLALSYAGRRSIRALLEKALSDYSVIPVLCAQRGDLVLVQRSRDVSLGVLALDGKAILAASQQGLTRLPLTLVVRAWRV